MRRDFGVYLEDIFNGCKAVQRYTNGLTQAEFTVLDEKQAAVERRLEIVGEAIAQCRIHHPIEVLQLGDVQGVINFRNYLAHRYHAVDPDIVWAIVEQDVPLLLAKVSALLAI
jgi:uncharacterized protein with HEPN domain